MAGIPALAKGQARKASVKLPKSLKMSEEALHRSVVQYLRAAFPDLFFLHVPNGGARSKSEAGRLKAMGTMAGAPDLLMWGNYSFDLGAIFGEPNRHDCQAGPFLVNAAIELKTEDGRQSPEQKAFEKAFVKLGGKYAICRSIDAVRVALEGWGLKSREVR